MSGGTNRRRMIWMRILLIFSLMAALSACETWNGFKQDVKTGADAVSDAL